MRTAIKDNTGLQRTLACVNDEHQWCAGALKEQAETGVLPCKCECHPADPETSQ